MAERAHPVAGAHEGEVGLHQAVEQGTDLGLDAVLDRRLGVLGRDHVERGAAHHNPGPVLEADLGQGLRLETVADELALGQAGTGEEGLVLGVGGSVVGTGGQEQEGSHEREPRGSAPLAVRTRECSPGHSTGTP